MPVTGDQQLLKQLNRMALVRQISTQPGLSRAALADVLGLTKSTVSLLVRELVDEGWLAESELRTTGEVGRRATPLHLDPGRLALLGADVGVDEARVVATDLLGNVLDSLVIPYDDVPDAAACIRLVALGLVRVARRLERPGTAGGPRRVLGIGIGLHGAVDEASGMLRHAPHLGWRNVAVGALVEARFAGTLLDGVPLYMQNEANVAALAEFEFTPQSATDPLIYLSIGYGVGAGVIVSDRLLTGLHGFAGEVGHAILQADGPLCSCGRRGCADALIGLSALLGDVRPSFAALEALFDRVEHSEPGTCVTVAAAGRQLGVLLNNLWASFDPMAIVIGGTALGLGDALIAPARDVLAGYADAAMLTAPAIRTSHFGRDAVAVGGAALARHRITRPLDDIGYRGQARQGPAAS
ncbi:ROK family protein [Pseudoduganella plicata]|uniref:Transcriptional regulator n=1 Tax=Pseudoduganella plicata TaxID=321984 RepID=A0A4P7B9D3_9BURK|nr:ROK family transcriptional regulator [Pseudoduganella plicata]QBQ34934.1 ROK family transcriptional regulator [Pseudoduganella plicata]GGZ06103.1 transcriptional regulator [Pseudoduganella plicata]